MSQRPFSWTLGDVRANSTALNLNFLSRSIFSVGLLALLVTFTGCASVSVGNIDPKGIPPKKLPMKIYVEEFTAPFDNFRVDRSGENLDVFVKKEQKALAEDLVVQLTKYIAPAVILPAGTPAPRGSFWLVHGVYDRVNQGSRLLRAGVGFGAGGTKLETRVQIARRADLPLDAHHRWLRHGSRSLGSLHPRLCLLLAGSHRQRWRSFAQRPLRG